MKEYKAHYLVPIVYSFMAVNDEEATQVANKIRLRGLMKLGDPGCPDLGCDALIEGERTVFEV